MTMPASARPDDPTEASNGGVAAGQYLPVNDVPLRPSPPAADADEDSALGDRPGGQNGPGDGRPADDQYVPM